MCTIKFSLGRKWRIRSRDLQAFKEKLNPRRACNPVIWGSKEEEKKEEGQSMQNEITCWLGYDGEEVEMEEEESMITFLGQVRQRSFFLIFVLKQWEGKTIEQETISSALF